MQTRLRYEKRQENKACHLVAETDSKIFFHTEPAIAYISRGHRVPPNYNLFDVHPTDRGDVVALLRTWSPPTQHDRFDSFRCQAGRKLIGNLIFARSLLGNNRETNAQGPMAALGNGFGTVFDAGEPRCGPPAVRCYSNYIPLYQIRSAEREVRCPRRCWY